MKFEDCPGLYVTVQVDGQTAVEYADEDDEKGNVKFIEAVTGARFQVRVICEQYFPYPQDDVDVLVYVDGKWTGGKVMQVKPIRSVVHGGIISNDNGRWTLERFTFGDLKTHDEVVQGQQKEMYTDQGCIKVEFRRGVMKSQNVKSGSHDFSSRTKDTIPEKALKGRAISTQAKLVEPETIRPTFWVNMEYPYGREPFAVANFKYRSHKDLQIEGVIERSPSPPPLELRDPASLTLAESRELNRRLLAQQGQATKIKTEMEMGKRGRTEVALSDTEDDEDDAVEEVRASKRARNDSGVELIDLTGD